MTAWAMALLAVVGTFAPPVREISRARRLELSRSTALPELVDLLRLATAAGASVYQVLERIEFHVPPEFEAALTSVRARVARGQRLGDALDALDDHGEAIRPLASALRAAAFDGVPLGPALDRVAADARLRRRRAAEIDARRLPVQLLFPLIVCILPAFGLLTVVPLLLTSIGGVHL